MSVISNNQLAGAAGQGGSGYQIDRSLRFNDGDTPELTRTPSSAGNTSKFTLSFWAKRCKLGSTQMIVQTGDTYANLFRAYWDGNDNFVFHQYNGSYVMNYITSAKYRDVGAWYHYVIALDTTQAAAADRAKLYVNGAEVTDFSATTNPALNLTTGWNAAIVQRIGREYTTTYGNYYNYGGYVAEFYNIDGQALAASDFGEFDGNNVWQPKEFTGSYGTHVAPTYDSTYGSDITSTEVAKTIDGDLSTYGVPTGDFIGYTYSASNEPSINIKWENTKSSSITVYIQPWVGGGAANSGTFDSSGGNSVTIAAGATLNTKFNFPSGYQGYFRVYTSGDGAYLRMYDTGGTREFNSFHLDFSDNSSNAALGTDSSGNSNTWTVNNLTAAGSAWDQSQTWSSSGSGTAYNSGTDWHQAFDGVITTSSDVTFSASDATMTWTPSSAITVNTSVTLYVYNPTNGSSYGTRVNGSYITGTNNYNVPVTLTAATLGGQLTSIQLTNSGLVGPYLGGVEVDGVLLVDSGVVDTAASNIDSLIDTPTNYEAGSGNNGGNYATINPLSTSSTFANGNLQLTTNSGLHFSTIGVSSGKWYAEWSATSAGGSQMVGISKGLASGSYLGSNSDGFGYYGSNGQKYNGSGVSYGATYGSGDVIGVALNLDDGNIVFYKNGTSQGTAFTGLSSGTYFFAGGESSMTGNWNFGQRGSFAYTPPADHLALCTTNLPDPTIADGSTAMDVVLYSGTGSSQTVGSLNFSPDLAWMKQRSGTRAHMIHDTVRGDNNVLYPSQNYAEHSTSGVTFGSTGFTLGTDAHVNQSSNTYAAWTWDAGSSNTSISVGGLNSSVYNQSQVWSTAGTITNDLTSSNQGIDKAFDGSLDNPNYWFAQNGTVSRYTFPSIQSGTKFELYMNVSIANTNFSVNGQQSSNVPNSGLSDQWVDVTDAVTASGLGGLSYIEISYAANQYSQYIFAIKIDGKTYVNAINDSQTWSNSLTGLSGSSLTNPPNAFDTDESSYADSTAGFTLDLSGHTFGTGAHTIEVKSGGATSFTVNGSTSLSGSGSGAIVWSGTHTGELTSLVSSATGASLYYIKIDGKYLANPGQNFVTNFPSIASTVRARPETGFSIVSYTGNGTNGATVGHKLNSKPGLILLKSRGDTQNWMVYHSALGANKAIFLSTTDSAATSSVYFSNTEPTSSVFSLGTRAGINQSSDPMIAYCFAPVEGYSAFGKFSGNSSTDGPFLYCGFKPRFLLLKGVTQARNWIILDTERDAGNVGDSYLHPDSDGAENTYAIADILSNGFKMRYAGGLANQTGEDYIWAAFASHPFKTARAR